MEACQKERSDSLWHAKWHQSQKRWRRWSLQPRLIEMKSYQENLPWSQVAEITQAWFSGQQLVTFLTFLRIVMYLVMQEVRKHIYICPKRIHASCILALTHTHLFTNLPSPYKHTDFLTDTRKWNASSQDHICVHVGNSTILFYKLTLLACFSKRISDRIIIAELLLKNRCHEVYLNKR